MREQLALKSSKRTVANVSAEFSENGAVWPSRKRNSEKKRTHVDSFTEGVIRRCVLSFYITKEFPTVKKIHSRLMEDENFPRICKSTLHNIMNRQLLSG